jgi:hypothetical protein
LCALAACGRLRETRLPDLSQEGAHSVLIAVETDDLAIYAWDLDSPESGPLDLDITDATIWLLVYRETLKELSIAPGWIDLESGGDRRLPEAASVKTAMLHGNAEAPWEDAALLPDSLAKVRLATLPKSCVDFEKIPIALEYGVQSRSLLKLDPRTAFIVDNIGDVFLIDVPAAEARRITGTSTVIQAGTLGSDGAVYLLTNSSALMKVIIGTPTTMEIIARPYVRTSDGVRAWLTASGADAPFELFAVGPYGQLARFDGTEWTELVNNEAEFHWRGSVVWVGARHVFATGPLEPKLLEFDDGAVSTHCFGDTPLSLPGRVIQTEDVGVVVMTAEGRLFRRTEGWKSFGKADILNGRSLAQLGDGFLIGGEGGALQQWYPDLACTTEYPVAGDINEVLRFGEDFLFASDVRRAGDPPLTILRRRHAP